MSRITRFAVLVTSLMSLFAVLSSTAGAVTWSNDGDETFTAAVSPGTLSATGANGLICPGGGTATGTVTPGTTAAVWSAVDGTVTWTGCQLGVSGFSVDCGYTLTAVNYTAISPAVTHGVADVTCSVYLNTTKFCHIEGSVTGSYTNPNYSTGAFGRLTINTGGNLTVTNGAGTCPLGSNDLGHLSEATVTISTADNGPISPHLGPFITRG